MHTPAGGTQCSLFVHAGMAGMTLATLVGMTAGLRKALHYSSFNHLFTFAQPRQNTLSILGPVADRQVTRSSPAGCRRERQHDADPSDQSQ